MLRQLRARLKKRHWIALVAIGLFAWWALAPPDALGRSKLVCAAEETSPAHELLQCVGTIRAAALAVADAFCPPIIENGERTGERQDCDVSSDSAAPSAEIETVTQTLDALPLGWATPALFPVPVVLNIREGQSVTLDWPSAPGDDTIRVARVHLVDRGAELRMAMTFVNPLPKGPENPEGTLTRTDRCTQTLNGALPTVRMAITALAKTNLEMTCERGPCQLRFDAASGGLPGNGQCERQ